MSDLGENTKAIYEFQDLKPELVSEVEYRGNYDSADNIIVWDNGSWQNRWGWHRQNQPWIKMKPILAKVRREKRTKNSSSKVDSELLVGNDLLQLDGYTRFHVKTPFDRNVVTQFETQETLIDYALSHLGLPGDGRVDHPMVVTEAFANPNSSRAHMCELLFECYSVPKLCFGLDALFSASRNRKHDSCFTGLVIATGYHAVHILPVVEDVLQFSNCRRINLGGCQLIGYLQRSLQLKHSAHVNNITVPRAEEVVHEHCHIAREYCPELQQWAADKEFYSRNIRRLQLPYNSAPTTKFSADPDILRQRRKELANRLVEINARKREQKLQEDENAVKVIQNCKQFLEQGYDEKAKRAIVKLGYSPPDSRVDHNWLNTLEAKIRARIEKSRAAISRYNDKDKAEEGKGPSEIKRRREDMDEDEGREFDAWIQEIRAKRQDVLDRRANRIHRKQQLVKRRTAASQERMRVISQLAKNSKKEDDFGTNDADWEVYKQISKDHGESESEEEQEQLAEYEGVLREHDPIFIAEEKSMAGVSQDSPEWHQLQIASERIKIPEILFQPAIIGHEQGGISETLAYVLNTFDPIMQQRLVGNVVVTGSMAKFPGFKARLERDLMEMRPFQSTFKVSISESPEMDAWFGAKDFALNDAASASHYFSRAEYEEHGQSGFFKSHKFSNVYFALPEKRNDI